MYSGCFITVHANFHHTVDVLIDQSRAQTRVVHITYTDAVVLTVWKQVHSLRANIES